MKKAYYADHMWYESQLYKDSWLLTDNETITGITSGATALEDYEKIRFKNSAIFPGLINTHTHIPMSLFRGMSDDLPLMTWLNEHIWPAEKKFLSDRFVYDACMLSAAELIRSGTTCINDMYFHSNACLDALTEASLRGLIGVGVMTPPDVVIKELDSFKSNHLVKAALAPHSFYVISQDHIKEFVKLSKEKDILLHMHLSENDDEVNIIKGKFGKTPVELANETGVFDTKSIFAHCVILTDNDIRILGEKEVSIAHCLESNLKLASGFAPVTKLMNAGANVTIGTDGAASNNDQSMIQEMSTVSKFHKAFEMDATVLSAETVLKMATENAAKALGLKKLGVLKEGNLADFFVLSFDSAHNTPVYSPISHLVYTATPNDVTDVFIHGKQVLKDRQIMTFDEEKVKQKARERAKDIAAQKTM